MTFEQFLEAEFLKARPETLDDDISDRFDAWLSELTPDDWIELGDRFNKLS